MKYEIKGMPNERVIKKYTISDDKKSIMVKYLDKIISKSVENLDDDK